MTGKGDKAAFVLSDSASGMVLSPAAELQLASNIPAHHPAASEDPGG